MKKTLITFLFLGSILPAFTQNKPAKNPESSEIWELEPRVVTPGQSPGEAPSDAIILFNGTDLKEWTTNGAEPKWAVSNGAVTVVPGARDIETKREFVDFQLHIEWRSPTPVNPAQTGQGRGNSGIFLQGLYEVQVLDSYNNRTYSNGQASSIYKQHIPLVNATRKPGEWQTYDIFFTAPRFNAEGRVVVPAYVTIIHNGVITLNHATIWGPTEYIGLPVYKPTTKGPIRLQDHDNPVSYRNIWIREL